MLDVGCRMRDVGERATQLRVSGFGCRVAPVQGGVCPVLGVAWQGYLLLQRIALRPTPRTFNTPTLGHPNP